MLRYVTKAHYWDVLERGIMDGIPGTGQWHLKDIQDAIAYSHLFDKAGLDIAEIGAGHPRMLGKIAEVNRCHAIDEYKGDGNGPKSPPKIYNVNFINCVIGKSEDMIQDHSYDLIFSVSVVEHVPDNALDAFFNDCWRILKPGGLMVHLIDVYTESAGGKNEALWRRVKLYIDAFNNKFSPCGSIDFSSIDDVAFKSAFATNPDDMMLRWNRSSPSLIEKRKVSQSCALEMVAHRIP